VRAIVLCANQPEHLAVVRKAPRGSLGKHQLSVDGDLEHAAVGGDQLAIGTQAIRELGRQTGGPRLVVSLAAVFDSNFHVDPRRGIRQSAPPMLETVTAEPT
jgi:hypothetical protein